MKSPRTLAAIFSLVVLSLAGAPAKAARHGPVFLAGPGFLGGPVLLAGLDAPEQPVLLAEDNRAAVNKQGPPINPEDYPAMEGDELAQFRWALRLAGRDLDDFSGMEAEDQLGMTSYRYCIAFTTYFLAIEQYHKLPACREIIRPRMDRMISKMQQKPVWDYWPELSKGDPPLEPLMNKPYEENRDPVSYRNIMYSGHLGHMIGLYQTLYRDMKHDRPGAIVFAYDDSERHEYSNYELQLAMHRQMDGRTPHCIECEPNACFPECNQHPVLSFMLYDSLHGTNLAGAREKFLDFFLENKLIDPDTHETAVYYLVKQGFTMSNDNPRFGNALDLMIVPAVKLRAIQLKSSAANGWTGMMMHAWQPEYIERHYPHQRDAHVIDQGDGTARLGRDLSEYLDPGLIYGFFATLAAEVGDLETRDKLVAHAHNIYDHQRGAGALRYTFNMDKKPKQTSLTGKLLAMARANRKDGLFDLHNKPFDDRHFAEPEVAGVDYPRLLLRRAIYDREKGALVVSTSPGERDGGPADKVGGPSGGKETSVFKVVNLDPDRTYTLWVDGEEKARHARVAALQIEVGLERGHDIVLAME